MAQAKHDAPPWISIHAPRKGSDFSGLRLLIGAEISIHAPRKGSDLLNP